MREIWGKNTVEKVASKLKMGVKYEISFSVARVKSRADHKRRRGGKVERKRLARCRGTKAKTSSKI